MKSATVPVEGMTCASCVARVEKALKKVDGVQEANVNLATEKVALLFDESKTNLSALASAVEGAGYVLALPPPEGRIGSDEISIHEKTFQGLKKDLFLSLLFGVPVLLISMASMTVWFMRRSPLSMDEVNKLDRKSTRLNSSHIQKSRMPSSA